MKHALMKKIKGYVNKKMIRDIKTEEERTNIVNFDSSMIL